jgi:hypothetical protein
LLQNDGVVAMQIRIYVLYCCSRSVALDCDLINNQASALAFVSSAKFSLLLAYDKNVFQPSPTSYCERYKRSVASSLNGMSAYLDEQQPMQRRNQREIDDLRWAKDRPRVEQCLWVYPFDLCLYLFKRFSL